MALSRKGGLIGTVGEVEEESGRGGGGENEGEEVSNLRIESSDAVESHGGGMMLARRWRLSKSASQRGRELRYGGLRGGIDPWH